MKKYYSILAATLLALAACGPKDDPEPQEPAKQVCNITSIDADMKFEYDADNRLTKVDIGDWVRSYSYSGNTMTIIFTENGNKVGSKLVMLNDAGLATQVVARDANDQPQDTTMYEYDADNQLLKTTVNGSVTTTCTWSNGDVMTETGTLGTENVYTYYTEHNRSAGDFVHLTELIYKGYQTLRNRHLVKSMYGVGGLLETHRYDLDAAGKILKVYTSIDGVEQGEAAYEYSCK